MKNNTSKHSHPQANLSYANTNNGNKRWKRRRETFFL